MTLIARVQFRHMHFYIADLLVSSPSKENRTRVDLPTHIDANSNLPTDSDYQISGLRQKINIIGSQLVIAFAGDVLQAYSLIRQLEALQQLNLLSKETFDMLIDCTPQEDRDDVALIGTIFKPKARGAWLQTIEYQAKRRLLRGGKLLCAGSGEKAFQKFLPNLLKLIPVPESDDGLYDWGDGFAVNLASNFLGREFFTGQTLLQYWGGGFEIATFQPDGRFGKLDDILFLFFKVVLSPAGDIGAIVPIPHIIKNNYFEDALVIRSAECELLPDGNWIIARDTVELVPPILKSNKDYDTNSVPKPQFTYTYLCCFLISPDKHQTGTSVYYDPPTQQQFMAILEEGLVRLSYRKSLYEELEARTSAMMGVPCYMQNPFYQQA